MLTEINYSSFARNLNDCHRPVIEVICKYKYLLLLLFYVHSQLSTGVTHSGFGEKISKWGWTKISGVMANQIGNKACGWNS